ncbi:MAG: metal-dependent phosphohydrolase [Treponema sp.]|jgi:response regulator RpfG family c-di-GMP phosphodiesterase|nr:metal-dependent phosphohydrolase [Treponema sp.]
MKKTFVLFQNSLFSLPTADTSSAPVLLNKYIDIMLKDGYSLLCINKEEQKKRYMPFRALYNNNKHFWLQSKGWSFHIAEDDLEEIRSKAGGSEKHVQDVNSEIQESLPEPLTDLSGFGSDYKAISAMTEAEKIQILNNDKEKIDRLIEEKSPDAEIVAETMIDSTKNAALINHTVLVNSMHITDSEAKKLTQNMVNSTFNMVESSAQLVSANILEDEMMNNLIEKSNGTIINHITKTYINGVSFLAYYNNLVSSSSKIARLRIVFAEKYLKYYRPLLPHIEAEKITLERVFYKGMRAISPELFVRWAVGFLIHDIGKAASVQYHEGEGAYNRDIVIEHVKLGYKYIMDKTNFPKEAGIIAGYHHEYYGDSAGYGYFRAYETQYKKAHPYAKHDFCISYELEPMLEYKTLAYFPAKVLEIIDIYDSMTDPHRKYKAALSHDEAIETMRDEFITNALKIDPIIFDFFVSFMQGKQNEQKKSATPP